MSIVPATAVNTDSWAERLENVNLRWWHLAIIAGAGLSLAILVGWLASGERGSRNERLSTKDLKRLARGRALRSKPHKSRQDKFSRKHSPQAKFTLIRQQVQQVYQWMHKMQQLLNLASCETLEGWSQEVRQPECEQKEGENVEVRVINQELVETKTKLEEAITNGQREARRLDLEKQLVEFLNNVDRQEASFPQSLTPFERFVVYEACEGLGLQHEKKEGSIVVTKLDFKLELVTAEEHPSVTLKRCIVLEEILTTKLLELDSLETGRAVRRDDKRALINLIQLLLKLIDIWKTKYLHGDQEM